MLPIINEPNPILHKKTADMKPADILEKKYKELIKNMVKTLYAKEGAGIAAPQVGHSARICVIAKNFNEFDDKKKDLILINPVWEKKSVLKATDEEGCLSVPNIFGKVKRYKKIGVSALNEKGSPINFIAKDFFARVIQHEVDHLNGILFIEKAKDLQEIIRE